jgi:predicted AAA+ superfamily ATPase
MLNRLCRVPERRSCFLFGPRQTGKSTLVRSILPGRSWTVDLLRNDTFLRYSKEPWLFRAEAEAQLDSGVVAIFVDEVQKIPALLDEVHSLIELKRARFILTGSSARKLKRGGANLLAGRAVTRHLHPLTMREQGDLFDLERTLRLGSLPAIVTSPEAEARDVLLTYGETYLREEIQAEALVRNLGGFGRFLDVAAAQCGDLLNFTAVGRDAALATRTVQEYFQILEDTLIGFRLEAWRKSPRARMVAHPKFYLFDTGVTNALNRRTSATLDPLARGRLFEQWIVLECLRLLDYSGGDARPYFWRTNQGAEVDLLIERHGKIKVAIEIKAAKRVASADLSGLRSFTDAHPKVPCLVVCQVPAPYRIGDVKVVPYQTFLDRFEDWL